jgi:hypothetical protein
MPLRYCLIQYLQVRRSPCPTDRRDPDGSQPSPPLTTIYYGIREEACLLQDYTTNLLDYARFIGDGIGLWDTLAGPNPNLAWECVLHCSQCLGIAHLDHQPSDDPGGLP